MPQFGYISLYTSGSKYSWKRLLNLPERYKLFIQTNRIKFQTNVLESKDVSLKWREASPEFKTLLYELYWYWNNVWTVMELDIYFRYWNCTKCAKYTNAPTCVQTDVQDIKIVQTIHTVRLYMLYKLYALYNCTTHHENLSPQWASTHQTVNTVSVLVVE